MMSPPPASDGLEQALTAFFQAERPRAFVPPPLPPRRRRVRTGQRALLLLVAVLIALSTWLSGARSGDSARPKPVDAWLGNGDANKRILDNQLPPMLP
jgi:hypothetical protein